MSSNVSWEMFKSLVPHWVLHENQHKYKIWDIFIKAMETESSDIIALQEIPLNRYSELEVFAEDNDYKVVTRDFGTNGMAVLYRAKYLLKSKPIINKYKIGRPYMILCFYKFTIVNLHAPHHQKIEYLIKPFENISGPLILVGDFNKNMKDIKGYINYTKENTCCSENKKRSFTNKPTDHILFSKQHWNIITETKVTDYYYSDHKVISATAQLI